MAKFAFIGAGSFVFTRSLARDLLTFPAFRDAEIALMDIDPDRLSYIKAAVDKIVSAGGYPAKVVATQDRAEALEGADGIVCTILSGGVDVWKHDILIPKSYGVDINVGDTRGPAGIFRALRTIPVMSGICRDIANHAAKNATLLNYTNPMAMLCRAIQSQNPGLRATGLCHSVQGTAAMLAGWIGAKPEDLEYTCAGVNHQAFYTKLLWRGEDAYPALREAMGRPEVYNEEPVRNEMFLALGYYPTESSGHNSEYNAWFRKRPDLIEKYCLHGTGWNPGEHAYILNEYTRREGTWKAEMDEWLAEPAPELARGMEYASNVFNALFGDKTPFRFNGNVPNSGLIDNLPQGACVELPCMASGVGIEPTKAGLLPKELAALIHTSAICEELAVEGALEGDARKIFQAIMFDPLTSAVLGLHEIKDMTRAMFEQNRDYLPQFKSFKL